MNSKFKIEKFSIIFNRAVSEYCCWLLFLDQTEPNKMLGYHFLIAQALITKVVNDYWDLFTTNKPDEFNYCSEISLNTLYWELKAKVKNTKDQNSQEIKKLNKLLFKIALLSKSLRSKKSVTWLYKHEIDATNFDFSQSRGLHSMIRSSIKIATKVALLFGYSREEYLKFMKQGIIYALGSMCYYYNKDFFKHTLDQTTAELIFAKPWTETNEKLEIAKENEIEHTILESFKNPEHKKLVLDILRICKITNKE